MSEQREPILTDAQRAEWAEMTKVWYEFVKSPDGLYETARTIVTVDTRLTWLEAAYERASDEIGELNSEIDRLAIRTIPKLEAERTRLVEENRRLREERNDEESAYTLLADCIADHFSVRDGEEAEVALLMETVEQAATELAQARAEQRRGEAAIRFAEAFYAWDKACREAPKPDGQPGGVDRFLAYVKPFEVAQRAAFEAYCAALASSDAPTREGER